MPSAKRIDANRPEYEIHVQHRVDIEERRTGHDDRNGRARSRNQGSHSTGITGHVDPEYPRIENRDLQQIIFAQLELLPPLENDLFN